MKAVILAAGLGSRLRPITDSIPKCMVQVHGKSIIERQISNLTENGVNDIVVVSGYKGDILSEYLHNKFPFVKIIENKEYEQTNNMYSLYLCMQEVAGDSFLLMNADVFFDASIVKGILNEPDENVIACDFNKYMEESMKVSVRTDGSVNHISKTISRKDACAVSIDVYKLGESGSRALFSKIVDFVELQCNRNSWTEVALDRIFPEVTFYPWPIGGRWVEIDNHDDLRQAEELFK